MMKTTPSHSSKIFLLVVAFMVFEGVPIFSQEKSAKAKEDVGIAAWQTEWKEFGNEVTRIYQQPNVERSILESQVNEKFSGKQATWTGVIESIVKPTEKQKRTRIVLSMEPLEVVSKSGGRAKLESITIMPKDDELASWKEADIGKRVVFQTTLAHKSPNDYFPVVYVVSLLQVGVVAIAETEGGKCLHLASEQKPNPDSKKDK